MWINKIFIKTLEFLRMRGCSKKTCEKVETAKVCTLYGVYSV